MGGSLLFGIVGAMSGLLVGMLVVMPILDPFYAAALGSSTQGVNPIANTGLIHLYYVGGGLGIPALLGAGVGQFSWLRLVGVGG